MGRRPSPAFAVAVVALVAALAGTAIAGQGPRASSSASAKKVAKKASKKAARALKIAKATAQQQGPQGEQGDQGPQGEQGDPGDSVGGYGSLNAVPQETILTVPAADLEVRTNGDVDTAKVVRLYNTDPDVADTMGHLLPGAGNAAVIVGGGTDFGVVAAPGDYAPSYVDGGSDPDTYDAAPSLDAVVVKNGVRVWVECVFPLDDVFCTATPSV